MSAPISSRLPAIRAALRWLLAALLVWAALGKIANPAEFHGQLLAYRLPLPESVLRAVAIVLPWLELLCGILLLAARNPRPATLWTAIMFAAFVLATGQAWARGLEISCGCFKLDFLAGTAAQKFLESAPFACIRALALWAASVWLLQPAAHRRTN